MTTEVSVELQPDASDHWITRIDKVRGVIDLSVFALWEGPMDFRPEAQCALDLANEELQRLRDEIDASRLAVQGREDSKP